MKPCTQNCLLVTDNSFNECTIVSRHISLYFVPDFIECFFSFSFLRTWPKTFTQSLVHTHTHPSKSKSQFGFTASASVSLCVCGVCVCVCWGPGWGGAVAHACWCAYMRVRTMLST